MAGSEGEREEGKGLITCKFTLEQRQVDPKSGLSYEPILSTIVLFLAITRLYVTHHNSPTLLLSTFAFKPPTLPPTSSGLRVGNAGGVPSVKHRDGAGGPCTYGTGAGPPSRLFHRGRLCARVHWDPRYTPRCVSAGAGVVHLSPVPGPSLGLTPL